MTLVINYPCGIVIGWPNFNIVGCNTLNAENSISVAGYDGGRNSRHTLKRHILQGFLHSVQALRHRIDLTGERGGH